MINKRKNISERGITLVALVVTIIVLLILAGVTLSLAINNNGLISRARQAKEVYKNSEADEHKVLSQYDDIVDMQLDSDYGKEEMIAVCHKGDHSAISLMIKKNRSRSYDTSSNNFTVDWGDGTINSYDGSYDGVTISHSYSNSAPLEETIKIKGKIRYLEFYNDYVSNTSQRPQVYELKQWGCLQAEEINFTNEAITEIPSPTYSSFENLKKISFEKCTNLTQIPKNLFANASNLEDVSNAFCECTNLQSVSDSLFINTPNIKSFRFTFYGCSALNGNATELWKRVTTDTVNYVGVPDGCGCFGACTGFSNYNTIPEYWKEKLTI